MAAPPNLSSLLQVAESSGAPFSSLNETHPPPPFGANPLPSETQDAGQSTGQNHDRSGGTVLLNIPPVVPPQPQQAATESDPPANPQEGAERGRRSDPEDGSGSEESDEEDERHTPNSRWQPIEEDKSDPCEDELTYIASRDEHSALDREHWETEAYFDVEDPEIIPQESGRIDWIVEKFNGTRESPNKEHVMRSPTVRIGGYDWCIKFYPRGNVSDYLSVYIENVTIQSDKYEGSQEFDRLPLPSLHGKDKPKRRRYAAAQVCVVMYNPAEPRVYEYKADAHQFNKELADYGWTHFTRYSRRDFHYRSHGQRKAILQDDKLAFSAYIRLVNDPTGCLWAHGTNMYEDSIATTALRPFAPLNTVFSAELPLLHFAPFRELLYRNKDKKAVLWLQSILFKMLCRKRSNHYGEPKENSWPSDPIAWLALLAKEVGKETDVDIVKSLIGTFKADQFNAVSTNKLRTKEIPSIQEAVDAHPTELATPALLTLELERHEFDVKERKWNKLTNKVDIQDKITVGGREYMLYAFSTHCGDLASNRFNFYVRPQGKLWYTYTPGKVTCLTRKQALEKHLGFEDKKDHSEGKRKRYSHPLNPSLRGVQISDDRNEVAHVVMYVREDYQASAFAMRMEEEWEVPESVINGKLPKKQEELPEPPPTACDHAVMTAEELQAVDEQREQVRKNSVDETAGYATPSAWPMDGEDVIMSDADEDSIYTNDAFSSSRTSLNDPTLEHITIDHLGRDYYKGQWTANNYHGEGHLIEMNGDEYIGTFREGLKHGVGKIVYAATGNIYDGDWVDGQHHGKGKLTEATTGNVFEGGWKEGKKHGEFVLKGTVTDEDKGCCSICYDKDINTAFYDCGHVIACKECANKIDTCPVCRKRVLARVTLYGVKVTFD